MAESLPTVDITVTTPWGLGKSGSETRPGFAQTDTELPDSGKLWKNYYDNVMRGNQDNYSDSSTVDYSRTYSDESSVGEKPPIITPSDIPDNGYTDENGYRGAPFGGMQPTIASPGEGNGVDPDSLPALNLPKPTADGTNGSIMDPNAGSKTQESCVDGTTRSPIYYAGYSGYSNPSGT